MTACGLSEWTIAVILVTDYGTRLVQIDPAALHPLNSSPSTFLSLCSGVFVRTRIQIAPRETVPLGKRDASRSSSHKKQPLRISIETMVRRHFFFFESTSAMDPLVMFREMTPNVIDGHSLSCLCCAWLLMVGAGRTVSLILWIERWSIMNKV